VGTVPTVGVIGAGPAGIMAALEAARRGARVTIYDTNRLVGRKLLVTGSGRCNISNLHASADRYVCADRAFMETALALRGPREILARLEELAVPTYATPDGWCYPLSDSAPNVVAALDAALRLAGVEVRLQTKVSDLRVRSGQVVLALGGPRETVAYGGVVVATGGMAYPALGATGEFFAVLESLGHTVVPVRPALAPITADMRRLRGLQGVRLDVGFALHADGKCLGETVGNLLFTDFGFSGPAPMDLSHLVSTHLGSTIVATIDLLPRHADTLRAIIRRMRGHAVPVAVALGAVLPAKVAPVMLRLAGLPEDAVLSDVDDDRLGRVLGLLRHVSVRVTGTRGFRFCQLSTGGVPVTEVDPRSMASRVIPGVHLAGEVLDVVGPCGGYNLQFAFTSGYLAGAGAAG